MQPASAQRYTGTPHPDIGPLIRLQPLLRPLQSARRGAVSAHEIVDIEPAEAAVLHRHCPPITTEAARASRLMSSPLK
jgi:hypothetical protein